MKFSTLFPFLFSALLGCGTNFNVKTENPATRNVLIHSCEKSGCQDNGNLNEHNNLDPEEKISTTNPEPSNTVIPVDFSFTMITTGHLHTCALSKNGSVWCWGNNVYGQLGIDSGGVRQILPVQTDTSEMGADNKFVWIAADGYSTCGLTEQGNAWCWGAGVFGNNVATPFKPFALDVSMLGGNKKFTQLALSSTHICGLSGEGKIYCWGTDSYESLGNGSLNNQSAALEVDTHLIVPSVTFNYVATGYANSCALTTDGVAYCWGRADFSLLGNNAVYSGNQNTPGAPVDTTDIPSGDKRFVIISVDEYVGCAITMDHRVACWGSGGAQLGNPASGISRARPFLIDDTNVNGSKNFIDVDLGINQACALTDDGKLYCWGPNGQGAVGIGSALSGPMPTAIDDSAMTDSKYISNISMVYTHSCAINDKGKAYCWGSNMGGQLSADSTALPQALSPYAIDISSIK